MTYFCSKLAKKEKDELLLHGKVFVKWQTTHFF